MSSPMTGVHAAQVLMPMHRPELVPAAAMDKQGASKFDGVLADKARASMYRYTQELDLVSRIVEKATTGLKDVVKTQV